MRNKILALCLLLICAPIGYAKVVPFVSGQLNRNDDAAGQTETAWIRFNSPAGRFSVLLPREPKFESVAASDTSGITNYRYSDIENGYGFICEYFDVESPGADVQHFLDVTRDGIVSGASATKVAEEKISLNSYPGRELQLALKVNETTEITGVTRIYLVDKRLYSLTFLHLKSMDATVAADLGKKFFASFELKPGR
ncbi:MAG: hypothetical protein QOF62_1638 [Pyrinomonadaceae bacterium]|jgi:hypothetical protein|nr:hypothetical protein [Pyrinomonadaceae bacterium]